MHARARRNMRGSRTGGSERHCVDTITHLRAAKHNAGPQFEWSDLLVGAYVLHRAAAMLRASPVIVVLVCLTAVETAHARSGRQPARNRGNEESSSPQTLRTPLPTVEMANAQLLRNIITVHDGDAFARAKIRVFTGLKRFLNTRGHKLLPSHVAILDFDLLSHSVLASMFQDSHKLYLSLTPGLDLGSDIELPSPFVDSMANPGYDHVTLVGKDHSHHLGRGLPVRHHDLVKLRTGLANQLNSFNLLAGRSRQVTGLALDKMLRLQDGSHIASVHMHVGNRTFAGARVQFMRSASKLYFGPLAFETPVDEKTFFSYFTAE